MYTLSSFLLAACLLCGFSIHAQKQYGIAHFGEDEKAAYLSVDSNGKLIAHQKKPAKFTFYSVGAPVSEGAYSNESYKIKAPNGLYLDANLMATQSKETAATIPMEFDFSAGNGAGALSTGLFGEIIIGEEVAKMYEKEPFISAPWQDDMPYRARFILMPPKVSKKL